MYTQAQWTALKDLGARSAKVEWIDAGSSVFEMEIEISFPGRTAADISNIWNALKTGNTIVVKLEPNVLGVIGKVAPVATTRYGGLQVKA